MGKKIISTFGSPSSRLTVNDIKRARDILLNESIHCRHLAIEPMFLKNRPFIRIKDATA